MILTIKINAAKNKLFNKTATIQYLLEVVVYISHVTCYIATWLGYFVMGLFNGPSQWSGPLNPAMAHVSCLIGFQFPRNIFSLLKLGF